MQRRVLLGAAAAGLSACAGAAVPPRSEVLGDAGYGLPTARSQQGDMLLLRPGDGGQLALLHLPWRERRGDRPALAEDRSIMLLSTAPDASDPLVPVRDGLFWQDPDRWLLWREAGVVHAVDTRLQRQALQLPAAPAALLRPALQRSGGPVELFALAADGRAVLRLVFPRAAESPPHVAARIVLPLRAARGGAGFAPAEELAFVLTANSPEGTVLLLHDGARLREARFPGLQARSAPVLLARGAALWVALVVESAGGLGVAEAHFPSALLTAATTLRALGPRQDLRGAALVYRAWDGAQPLLHGVFALADGRHLKLDAEGLSPFEPPAPPVTPLVLVPGAQAAMLLCHDAQRGPMMAAI